MSTAPVTDLGEEPFFQRPISTTLLVLAVALLAAPALRRVLGRRFSAIAGPAPG